MDQNQNDFERVQNNKRVAREAEREGNESGFDAEKLHKQTVRRQAKLVVKATMIAAGIEPASGQWETAEAAEKWLMAIAKDLRTSREAAEAAE